jgi:hypothetical protein
MEKETWEVGLDWERQQKRSEKKAPVDWVNQLRKFRS